MVTVSIQPSIDVVGAALSNKNLSIKNIKPRTGGSCSCRRHNITVDTPIHCGYHPGDLSQISGSRLV